MLSLLLLQHALAPGIIDAHARSRLPAPKKPASSPYLKVATMVLPLRFNSAPPPPDLAGKPGAGAPPRLSTENEASEPIATTPVVAVAPPPVTPVAATTVSPAPPIANSSTPVAAKPEITTPTASAILPDDTRPATKAEDFLPFFQFPTNGGDVTVLVPPNANRAPAPAQQPLSSATFQQK